ncbi:hypothetical protein AB205_0115140 [Aquarana catesbeiana]|uniref:Uncharacterized protein n=1 Tax=Aquarana catesbeiana TaxID=8400 RepID=A0A2G9S4S0_AQUCT|nr:hypothetical protein AB205_0115140 [Aquarana catesbeiana]
MEICLVYTGRSLYVTAGNDHGWTRCPLDPADWLPCWPMGSACAPTKSSSQADVHLQRFAGSCHLAAV